MHYTKLHPELFRLFLLLMLATSFSVYSAELAKVNAGSLAFGTNDWEYDVIKYHELDRKQGIELITSVFSSKNAVFVALKAGMLDIAISDWTWVSRQRHTGADFTLVPHSLMAGELLVRPDAGIKTLADLKGRKIGIAGGPLDKSWLILRAYAAKTIGTDLTKLVEPVFTAPPLLNKLMLQGEIPATLNFWYHSTVLKAAGMHEVISIKDTMAELGIKRVPPLLSWVFSESWARSHPNAIQGFLNAVREAKNILLTSNSEWDRIRPLMHAKDDSLFVLLRDSYRANIPKNFDDQDIAAVKIIYATMAKYGGRDLIGENPELADGTFWPGYHY